MLAALDKVYSEAVVRLLAERDAVEAYSKDKESWKPLLRAAQAGREALVTAARRKGWR